MCFILLNFAHELLMRFLNIPVYTISIFKEESLMILLSMKAVLGKAKQYKFVQAWPLNVTAGSERIALVKVYLLYLYLTNSN